MSRHRAVRNLDIDDVLDEGDYEDDLDEAQMSAEDLDALEDGLIYVYSVVGEDIPMTNVEIKEALWYYYFDREETVKWVLDQVSKAKAKAAKVETAAAAAAKVSKPPSKPTIAIDVGDDEVEYLSDDSNNQLHQDMAGLGLGSIKSSKKQTSQVKSSEHTSAASISTENNTNSPLPSPLTKIHPSKRINVIEEYAKRSSEKPKLNLVVIGHVDAGKSTLMGHFLYSLGQVNDRVMKKYERDSQKIGKGSFAYAWVLDETDEERERGITMDIAMNNFETLHRKFTLLDAPGHRDFIPNMISGTSQADVAILVVDAAIGGFESGFDGNGQTKEHALLARSLGVQQMIIAINKLDVMAWDKSRFDEIVTKVGAFLVQAGFRKSNLSYVPVSGLTGDNLTSPSQSSELIAWYNGPSLLELIDMFEPPVRLLDKPFRMSTSDFFKGGVGSSSGVSIAGTIDAGSLQVGEQVVVIPGGESGTVKAMQVNDESANWCAAGDSVLITFSGLDILSLSTGCVLCSTSHPVSMTTTFVAQIVVFDIKVPITCGFPVILYHHSVNEPASIVKLLTTVDKATGEVIKKNPRHLTKGNTATIKIQLTNRPIPLELFKDNKQLGRIMLRKGGDTVAAGVVTKILTFGS
ncbi:P-loop containing nucleoside triphosphate hydrolase protein [Spinellus fusiger]|nr:P-loop containing nucleoside triphosphate hydrolase protein [Spinellus fusiger]